MLCCELSFWQSGRGVYYRATNCCFGQHPFSLFPKSEVDNIVVEWIEVISFIILIFNMFVFAIKAVEPAEGLPQLICKIMKNT